MRDGRSRRETRSMAWPAIVLVAFAASHAARGQTPPVVSTLVPPGVAVGSRETWVIRGERLRRVERVEVEGADVRAVVTRATDDTVTAEVTADPKAAPGYREVRVVGPDGVSNLRLVRVDGLTQSAENEPNDRVDQATPLPAGAAGVGVLGPQDVDYFRVVGTRGQSVVVDLEARRLGVAIAPVVTVLSPTGRALRQGRETPGVEGDCRFVYTFPADGVYVVQVRDNLYGGSDGMPYRLRVSSAPYATGMFPLGGPAGKVVTVAASGGTLGAPLQQSLSFLENPGLVIDPPPFERSGGLVLAPGRLVVGDGPERAESESTRLMPGVVTNGRIARAGESDRYRIRLETETPLTISVTAASLGSWLDAVLTVRDDRGNPLAAGDDTPDAEPVSPTDPPNPDSRVVIPPGPGGELAVEITDRYGRGGPEFGYRLVAGPQTPDFRVSVVPDSGPTGPNVLPSGVVVLRPGAVTRIVTKVTRLGRTGPITLRVEGLPEGVRSSPVVARIPRAASSRGADVSAGTAVLELRAASGVGAVSGRLRVVATAAAEDGRERTRVGECRLTVGAGRAAGAVRPIVRTVTSIPFWVYIGGDGR